MPASDRSRSGLVLRGKPSAFDKTGVMSGPGPPDDFHRLMAAALDDALRQSPEWATYLGDHRFDAQLDDLSEEGLSAKAQLLRSHRDRLAGLDRERLGSEDRVDLALVLGELDKQVFAIDELAGFRWDPLVYNIGEALYPLLTRDVLPLPDRLRAIAARLELVPQRVDDARRQLEAPPHMHVETALRRHQGARAMVGEEVDRLLDGEPGLRPVVEPAQRRALEALEGFEGTLRDLLEGPHRSPRIGPDLYARLLALELSSSMAPVELLARAEHRIEELDEQLEEVARQ